MSRPQDAGRAQAEPALGCARAVAQLLTGPLADARVELVSGAKGTVDGRLAMIDEMSRRLASETGCGDRNVALSETLADWLEAVSGQHTERTDTLVDVVSLLARSIAPDGVPPASGPGAEVWNALITVVDRIYGSGVQSLGRLPFVSDRLLEMLAAEARSVRRDEERTGTPRNVLASLAVSGKLRRAVAAAFAFPVVPTYEAVYLYDRPGSHVRTHVDRHDYELVFHLVLDHVLPGDGSTGSALLVHVPEQVETLRLALRPGEAVALRGRGTLHSWERLRSDERRTLIAIGFERAREGAKPSSGLHAIGA